MNSLQKIAKVLIGMLLILTAFERMVKGSDFYVAAGGSCDVYVHVTGADPYIPVSGGGTSSPTKFTWGFYGITGADGSGTFYINGQGIGSSHSVPSGPGTEIWPFSYASVNGVLYQYTAVAFSDDWDWRTDTAVTPPQTFTFELFIPAVLNPPVTVPPVPPTDDNTKPDDAKAFCFDPCCNSSSQPGVDYTPVDGGGLTAGYSVDNFAATLGMPRYNVTSSVVSLTISDTPVAYHSPFGPAMGFTVTYNQREANQPATFNYSNLGQKWTFNWLSYVTDDPTHPASNATVYVRGGGTETYSSFNTATQSYALDIQSHAQLVRTSANTYEKRFPDGSKEVFGFADGSSAYPRKIFLTQVINSCGIPAVISYDSNVSYPFRITAITDAMNNSLTLAYEVPNDPFKVTSVTDANHTDSAHPNGRSAQFEYLNGQLWKITDEIGIASQFTYDTGSDFINTLTTPYGSTTFSTGQNGTNRWLEITDPISVGGKQRVEYRDFAPNINKSDALAPYHVLNQDLDVANTYIWDRKAMSEMKDLQGNFILDYTKARCIHWLFVPDKSSVSSIASSEKQPLENRVWYLYDGQIFPNRRGTSGLPTKVQRILDDGTTQAYQYTYNALGKITNATDPIGRVTTYVYDTNNIDLLQIRNTTGTHNDLLLTCSYNSCHLPLTVTDPAGNVTGFSYNNNGQLLSSTNAKLETTTLTYDPTTAYLQSVVGALSSASTSFIYDNFGRVHKKTDSESYQLIYDYDDLDRLTKTTYPDNTYTLITYDFANNRPLDVGKERDRAGRETIYAHDALQHLTDVWDPANNNTHYEWCMCGALESITDPKLNTTTWDRDIQGRPVEKKFADQTKIHYAYDNARGLLTSSTDALNQVTNFSYFIDNNVSQVSYSNTIGSKVTPSVNYTYDVNYNRISTMTDGIGTTNYYYYPVSVGTLGAGQLQSITGPLANSTITFGYDELGRVNNRTINGNAQGLQYDSLGRIFEVTNLLGTFNNFYVGATAKLDYVNFPNGTKIQFGYYTNAAQDGSGNGDRRLQEIKYLSPSSAVISQFDYTYDVPGKIQKWTQAYLGQTTGAQHYDFNYDLAGQLLSGSLKDLSNTLIKPYVYGYDVAGNILSSTVGNLITSRTINSVNQITNRTGDVPNANGTMTIQGSVNKLAQVKVNGVIVGVTNNAFTTTLNVTTQTNLIPIQAKDGSGNVTNSTLTMSGQYYDYDLNGNMLGNGLPGRTYEWDAANRCVAINQGTHRTELSYDGLNREVKRVEKENGIATGTSQFVWCGFERCEEQDGIGDAIKQFYAQGVKVSASNYYYTRDHLGSIREVTDTNGQVVARYDYDPFGQRVKLSGVFDADFGYTGYFTRVQWSDLTFAPLRIYSPELGRFISRDPIGEDGGLNLYEYVRNNSVNHTDPLGLQDIPTMGTMYISLSQQQAASGYVQGLASAQLVGVSPERVAQLAGAQNVNFSNMNTTFLATGAVGGAAVVGITGVAVAPSAFGAAMSIPILYPEATVGIATVLANLSGLNDGNAPAYTGDPYDMYSAAALDLYDKLNDWLKELEEPSDTRKCPKK